MYKIHAQNKQYNGVTATVPFVNGVATTDNDYLADWFEKNGYKVENEENEGQQQGNVTPDIGENEPNKPKGKGKKSDKPIENIDPSIKNPLTDSGDNSNEEQGDA